MRKLVVLLGLAIVLVMATAGVALAVDRFNVINCKDVPCNGTHRDDLMHERQGTVKDVINAYDGHDVLDANNFNKDRDRLYGGALGDKLLTNDGDGRDVAKGGQGRNVCFVDPGDRARNCDELHRRALVRNDYSSVLPQ